MKKTNNSKIVLVVLAVMLVFGVIAIMPESANANYGSYYGDYYPTYTSNRYGYGSTYTPIVVTQPVYITQPVYVAQPVVVQQPVVIQYQTLSASCSASVSYNSNYGLATVVWTVNPIGGNGYYNYSWSGTDGLIGSTKSVYYSYSFPGLKYASVNISSGGYTITANCSPVSITHPQPIYQPIYQTQPVYQNSMVNRNLDIGCYADPTNAKINQPVNWSAEVTGGIAPYTYSWSGSDDLNGNQSSIVKYYYTSGSKSAIVSVTSADGRTGVKACSNTITITSAYKAPVKEVVKAKEAPVVTQVVPTPSPVSTTNLTATSMFSLGNVPWGWVLVLIILVLFFTVMYLLFNRKKI